MKQKEIKKARIKEIWGEFRTPHFMYMNVYFKRELDLIVSYDFERLKRDIKEQGIKTLIQCAELEINNSLRGRSEYEIVNKELKYRVLDGNHRMYVLKELYGEDYELEIQIEREGIENPNFYR